MSSEQQNSDVVRTFWERVFGECRLEIADTVLAETCVLISADDPTKRVDNRDGIKKVIELLHESLTAVHVTVKEQVGGDKIVALWEGSGDHTREVLGIPPTYHKVKLQGIGICSISGGKIQEIVESSTFTLEEPIGTQEEMFLRSWWRRHLAKY